ncbi:hypothetical protein VTK26DRAFT_5965 [Humicola hyalothermophila]
MRKLSHQTKEPLEGRILEDVVNGLAWCAWNPQSLRDLEDPQIRQIFRNWIKIIRESNKLKLDPVLPRQIEPRPAQKGWRLTCCSCGMELLLQCSCGQPVPATTVHAAATASAAQTVDTIDFAMTNDNPDFGEDQPCAREDVSNVPIRRAPSHLDLLNVDLPPMVPPDA